MLQIARAPDLCHRFRTRRGQAPRQGAEETALGKYTTAGPPQRRKHYHDSLVSGEQWHSPSKKHITWTPERIRQPEEELKTCNGTVAAQARQIAERCGWPAEKVRSKLYEMQHRAGRPSAREAEEPAKEDDQRAQQETIPT